MAQEQQSPARTMSAPARGRPGSERAVEIWEEISRLDLRDNIAELEAKGLTVVPPEKVGPPEFAGRLRDAILRIAEDRSGEALDLTGASESGSSVFGQAFGLQMFYLLFEDPVFPEAVLNPTGL